MKKFLSIVAVVALVFALAVPAFAADAVASVTYDDNAVTTNTTIEAGETTIEVKVSTADTLEDEQATALTETVNGLSEDVAVVNVVNVWLKDENGDDVSETYFDDNKSLQVAFAVDQSTQKVVAVLYWNAKDSKWDSADFTSTKDGVTVTFKHLCDVAFVMADVTTDPTQSGTTNTANKTTQTASKGTSPQTGYDVLGWAVAVSALVMAAGYCFVSARKVTE
jgi:hypothetical protein